MQTTALVYALLSQTAQQVGNGSRIIPGQFPIRHTLSPSTENVNFSVGSGGGSLPSRLEELLWLNMHSKLARHTRYMKYASVIYTWELVNITRIKWILVLLLHIFHTEVGFYQLHVTSCPHTLLFYSPFTRYRTTDYWLYQTERALALASPNFW